MLNYLKLTLILQLWLIYLNKCFIYTKKIACNACIYQPVVSDLKTHFFGSKNHLIDFEFQIPCTFYNPMITVSVPKGFIINSIKLLPSNKIGKFEDSNKECNEIESELDYTVSKGLVYSDNKDSKELNFELNGLSDDKITCKLGEEAEEELYKILTSLGFESWEVISQNSSKCLKVPEYEVKGNSVIKVMDNLLNGSYVLRFDLENPKVDEFFGNWNLSITSTKNNMPTTPFCLTSITENSVSKTLGPLLSSLKIRNATFNSYYKGSQQGEFSFLIERFNLTRLSNIEDKISGSNLEPIRIRLTFPSCENENDCFSLNKSESEDFCEILNHKYECYIENMRPNLVLIIGFSESMNDRNLESIFPMKVGVKKLVIPQKLDINYNLKLEVLTSSVPSSKPVFLKLNESTIEMIQEKNDCIGEWIKFLLDKENNKFHLNDGQFLVNSSKISNDLIYSPISIGTYRFPKLRDIQIQIRYRITSSENYPILLRVEKINDKISDRYNIRIRSLLEGIEFLKEGIDKRIAYSNILLQALIYDKSKFQEEVNIEFETNTNSIFLRNIDPNYAFECILLVNNNQIKNGFKKKFDIFETRKEEWDVEMYSISDINMEKEQVLFTKKKLFGETLDIKETEITDIGGPLIFLDFDNNYFMVIYFYISVDQYNKAMTISLSIPNTITEHISEELKVEIYSPETNFVKNKNNKNITITKYCKENILIIVLESYNGFSQGWWGLSIQITKPNIVQPIENNNYVEFNISSSVSNLNNPYLTSLLFLSVHENYKGPYLSPIVNKIIESSKRHYIFQIVSIQQNHSSYHPFPLLENQVIDLETNSPDYLITKLMYMEKFRFIYIIDEKSLNNKEINLKTREIDNLGNSKCQIFLLIGNGYFKESGCGDKITYKRIDQSNDDENNQSSRINTDIELIKKILQKVLKSKNNYIISLITLIIDQNSVEQLDRYIFETDELIPNERVNYNFIIKKYNQILTSKLNLDPNPSYYESFYQFKKALISNQYYNLYTVPSSMQALKVCPPEIPLLSKEKVNKHPLIFRFKYFDNIISSYNYSVTPNIPGTCLKQKLLTSNSLHLGISTTLILIAIQSLLMLTFTSSM